MHIFGKVTWSLVLFDVLNSEMMSIGVGVLAGGVATVSDYISGSHSRGRGPSRGIWGSRCRVRMFSIFKWIMHEWYMKKEDMKI